MITVDAEGNVAAVGLGTASVNAENGGARTFLTFMVEDLGHPQPPRDLTGSVRIGRSPLELDADLTARQKTPIYAQTVTITNATDWPLIGPLHMSVQDLPKEGWLFGFRRGAPISSAAPKDGVTSAPAKVWR